MDAYQTASSYSSWHSRSTHMSAGYEDSESHDQVQIVPVAKTTRVQRTLDIQVG
jgi:hypothetical protein